MMRGWDRPPSAAGYRYDLTRGDTVPLAIVETGELAAAALPGCSASNVIMQGVVSCIPSFRFGDVLV